MVSPGAAFLGMLRRDLLIAWRSPVEVLHPLVFFAIVVALFRLGAGPAQSGLAALGPGVLWVAALLATLLGLDALFRADFEDGSLEQILLCPAPLPLLIAAKVFAHWLSAGLPLLLLAPLVAAALGLDAETLPVLLLSLALGGPALSLVGAIGVALTVGLRRGGTLVALLVLPLYIPVLVFGAQAVSAAGAGLPAAGALYMLSALLVLALVLSPLAAAAALRISLD